MNSKIEATDFLKKKISDIISPHVADRPDVAKLLTICVGRILYEYAKENAGKIPETNFEDLKTITGWLTLVISENDDWLHDTDSNGNPRKLLGFSSFEDCANEAKKHFHPEAGPLKFDLGNGYLLKRIVTADELAREGAELNNDVSGEQFNGVSPKHGDVFYSLRGPDGARIATIETNRDGEVFNIYAKDLDPLDERHRYVLLSLNGSTNLVVSEKNVGFVRDRSGKLVDFHNLSEGCVFDGDLYLSHTNVSSLPDNMTVNGDLELIDTPIFELPSRLTVNGDLATEATYFETIPDCIRVSGDMYMQNSSVISLPDNLEFGGGLYLNETEVSELPNGLNLKNLDISGTNIEKLPDDIRISGDLNIGSAPVTELPESLTVGGDIKIITNLRNIKKLVGFPDETLVETLDLHNDTTTLGELRDRMNGPKAV